MGGMCRRHTSRHRLQQPRARSNPHSELSLSHARLIPPLRHGLPSTRRDTSTALLQSFPRLSSLSPHYSPPPRPTRPVRPLSLSQCSSSFPTPPTPIMMGFVSSFAGSATLAVRARSALAGRAVAVSPSASARTARWTMVKSKAMPFMEAPPALDGTMAGGTFFFVVARRRRPRGRGLSLGGWACAHGTGGVGRHLPLAGVDELGDDRPLTRGDGGGAAARMSAEGVASRHDLRPPLSRGWLSPCTLALSFYHVHANARCCICTLFYFPMVTIVCFYSPRFLFLRRGL